MTTLQPRQESTGSTDSSRADGLRPARLGDYVSLTKPRIIELLLITTFPVMFLAERGIPSVPLVLATLLGGTCAAAGSNVFNCIVDRDIDRLMHRTEDRPLATGVISVRAAVIFGTLLTIASVVILWAFVNALSAALAFGAVLLYVVFYTMVLKRRTAQNIVWGGVAGCMPVLIGWSAVTDRVDWAPIVLFLVVFFWTPPHYWPLSMRFKDDYAAAGVPMLPVVAEDSKVAAQVVIYSWVTVLVSLALIPIAPMGWIYTVAAVVSGAVFIAEAHALQRRAKDPANTTLTAIKPMRLFHYSISYLTLLFVGVALDPLFYFPLPI